MPNFRHTQIAFAAILMIQTCLVHAQKSDEEELSAVYGDKSTISIATGNAQPLRRAPAVATVITAEDIAAMGATDLGEVLESVPGFHVSKDRQAYVDKYIVRGVGAGGPTTPQLLFLQNGIARTNLYSGDQGNVMVSYRIENIARIEIIRGPGSALYGADAYSGVVNVITKNAADTPGLEFGMRGGSQKAKYAWLQYGGKIGSVDTAFFVSGGRSDRNSNIIYADAATNNDKVFKTKTSLAPGPLSNQFDSLDIGIDLSYGKFNFVALERLRENIGLGAGTSSALDPNSKYRTERTSAALTWADKNIFKDISLSTTISYMSGVEQAEKLVLFPAGTRLSTGFFPDGVIGGPGRWERQLKISGFASYSGFKGHQIRVGLGHEDLDLYKAVTFKNYTVNAAGTPVPAGEVQNYTDDQAHILPFRRKVNYIYAQNEWKITNDLALTAGVRHDRYSDFGRTTNPRLALVWDTTPTITTKFLYGEAFRAPSFNESRGINPVAKGNPDLGPETISTKEFVTSWQASESLQLNLNIFRFNRKNIISVIPNERQGTGATYANSGSQIGKGLELELGWNFSRSLRMVGNYSYQKTTDGKSNRDVGYAPHHHLYGRVDWRFANGWQLNTQLNWIADRDRPVGDARPEISDYKTVDLILRTNKTIKQWDFSLAVRNLFNTSASEPSLGPGVALPNDLPLSGRTIQLQAVFRM